MRASERAGVVDSSSCYPGRFSCLRQNRCSTSTVMYRQTQSADVVRLVLSSASVVVARVAGDGSHPRRDRQRRSISFNISSKTKIPSLIFNHIIIIIIDDDDQRLIAKRTKSKIHLFEIVTDSKTTGVLSIFKPPLVSVSSFDIFCLCYKIEV